MPVVSQSMRNEIVPVGARTVAWALRYPWTAPMDMTSSQALRAAFSRPRGTASSRSRWAASRCLDITRSCPARFFAYSAYGPTAPAMRADCAYASPVMSAVIAAA